MQERLTKNQENFVLNLIQGMSQRNAYKGAYNTKKMKDKSIDEKASRLFADAKVRARFNEIHDRLIKEAEDEGIINAKKVLKHVASIAFDDIGNYLDFRTEKQVVAYSMEKETDKDGKEIEVLKPVFGYKNIIDFKDSKNINTQNISEITVGKKGECKIKPYNRDTALYKLMEHLGVSKADEKSANIPVVNISNDLPEGD